MSAQNSSTQAPTQDTHSESDIHARLFPVLARVASVTAVLMYVFYFPQIIGISTAIRATGFSHSLQALTARCGWHTVCGAKKKDWPIVIANAPGNYFWQYGSHHRAHVILSARILF